MHRRTFPALLALPVLALLAAGCDQFSAPEQPARFIAHREDAQLVARVERLLAAEDAAGKNSSALEGELRVQYDGAPRSTLRFASLTEYRRAVYAVEAVGDLEGYTVTVPQALSRYVAEAYLTPAELSFFDHEGRVAVGDTLYAISDDVLRTSSITTGLSLAEVPVWRSHYVASRASKAMDGYDERFSYEQSAQASDGFTYRVRGFAFNRSYNTGAPLWRSWADSGTQIQLQDPVSGQFVEVHSSRFPDAQVKVSMTMKRRVWFSCKTRTESRSATTSVDIDSDRCDNTGVTSKHQASTRGQIVIWGGGDYPELSLE